MGRVHNWQISGMTHILFMYIYVVGKHHKLYNFGISQFMLDKLDTKCTNCHRYRC